MNKFKSYIVSSLFDRKDNYSVLTSMKVESQPTKIILQLEMYKEHFYFFF